MKKHLGTLLKLSITGVLLWLIFRDRALAVATWQHLGEMGRHWGWTLAGVASMGLSLWLEGYRWEVLLRCQDFAVRTLEVTRLTLVANFFNVTSLGSTGGDAYRVFSLAHGTGSRRSLALATVLLDHMLGTIGTALIYLACSVAMRERLGTFPPEVRAIVKGFEVFMAGSVVGIVLAFISLHPRLYGWSAARHPKLLGWPALKNFALACNVQQQHWAASLAAVALTIPMRFTQFFCFYCAVSAVGSEVPLFDVLAAMPIVDAAAGLPISVSGLGVREKTFSMLIHAFTGLNGATAVSASLAGWMMNLVWGLVGGLMFVKGVKPAPAPERPAGDC